MDQHQVRQLILQLLSDSEAQTAPSEPTSPNISLQLQRSAPQPSTSIPALMAELVPPPLRSAPGAGNSTENRSTVFQPRSHTVQHYQGDQNCDAVNEEMSRLFAPYNSLGNATNSIGIFNPVSRVSQMRANTPYSPGPIAGSSRGRAGASSGALGAIWSKEVLLLGDPSESHVPNSLRTEQLSAVYLRRGALNSHRNATQAQLMIDLDITTASMEAEREEKRFSSVNWTLLYAKNKGTNQRLLDIYPEATPRVISTLKASSLYARPDVMLYPLPTKTPAVEDFDFEEDAVLTPVIPPLTTPAPVSILLPSPAPVQTPSPVPVSLPSPAPVQTPSPVPVSLPFPAPVLTPSSVPVTLPSPAPVQTPSPVPVTIPTNGLSSGFAFNYESSDDFEQSMFGDIYTLRDLRDHMRYFNRDRQEINIKRINGVISVTDILGLYTPSFNIYKEPYVTFLGEPGVDMDGLTREFFGTSQLSLMYTSYSHGRLFEGQSGHLLPSTNVSLLVSNSFAVLGQFMLHSYFNVEYFFVGISKVVAQFILLDDVSSCFSSLLIDDKDLPCEPSVHVLNELRRINNSPNPISEEDQYMLRTLLSSFSISQKVVKSHGENNIDEIIKLLKYSAVIIPRMEQMLQLRKSLRDNVIFHFLKFRQDLYHKAWKNLDEMEISVCDIMKSFVNIDSSEFSEIKNFLLLFLESKVGDGVTLRAFVLWITGLPIILEHDWHIRWQERDRVIQVSVCTKTMIVSRDITQQQFNSQLEHILLHPCEFTVV